MKKTELAWAAGFFDGEGCFSAVRRDARRGRYYVPIVSICQSDPEVLERFLATVEVGRFRGPVDKAKNPLAKKPYWYFKTERQGAIQVARVLWPYLGTVKRTQWLTVVDKCSNWGTTIDLSYAS